jgi:hypothetical protein
MADAAAAGEEVDNEINLEQLQLLKNIFEACIYLYSASHGLKACQVAGLQQLSRQ